ncbi:MAG: hypothetical protein ACREBS_04680 [Nitrososphaerales archaeon]
MNRGPALIGSVLLLSILILGTVVTAVLYSPPRTAPTQTTATITARTVSSIITITVSNNVTTNSSSITKTTALNKTQLAVKMNFPNGSNFDSGVLYAGSLSTNASNGEFVFPKINPGTYPLSIKGARSVYLPPTVLQLSAGVNFANITVYPVNTFVLYFSNGLYINGTQPGPSIIVPNASAVELVLINNTTLIHNLAVVRTLGNESSENILFNSLSYPLNAGGTLNDTFVVTTPGYFYYEDLIGNHARAGDNGPFYVLSSYP